jgi:hypothetical protein
MNDILRLIPTKLPAVIQELESAGEFGQWLQHGTTRCISYFTTKPGPDRSEASVSAFMSWAHKRITDLHKQIDGDKPSKAKAMLIEEIHRINTRMGLIGAVRKAHQTGQVTLTQMRRVKERVGDPDVYSYIVTKTKR